MKIGVPKEIKNNEFRVSLTPHSVKSLTVIHMMFLFKVVLEPLLALMTINILKQEQLF